MTAPLVTLLFGVPILLAQVILWASLLLWKRHPTLILAIQGALACICLASVYQYWRTH